MVVMMNGKLIIYWMFLFMLLVAAMPLLILVAAFSAFIHGFPLLYRQKRTGINGKSFIMYKFRTMVAGAERMQKKYARQNEADGPVFKIRDDPRFTRLGTFLSHSGLDELPQLVNVIRGEMAILGPRPLPVKEAAKLAPWMRERHCVKPGIISPWVLDGYHSRPFDEWMESDIRYTKEKSLWYDLVLFGKAVAFVAKLFMREVVRQFDK